MAASLPLRSRSPRHAQAGRSNGTRRAKKPPGRPQGPLIDLTVETLVSDGAGLARGPDGAAVFVDRAAPGDRVLARRADAGPRGVIERLLSPGPDRVEAPCRYAATCGGCDWMHLSVSAQAREHARLVATSLTHAMGVSVEVSSTKAPKDLRFRSRARMFVHAVSGPAELGYRQVRSHDLTVIDDCIVLLPELALAAREAAAWLDGARGEGELSIGLGLRGDGCRAPVVDLEWKGDDLPSAFWGRVDVACATAGAFAGARVRLPRARDPVVFGDPRAAQLADDGGWLRIRAGGFAQASDEGAALLARRVRALSLADGLWVHELFAGSGTLSIALAGGARRFSSLEADGEAATCARENLSSRGLSGKLGVGDAEASPVPKGADVVVLDPPRAGAPGATRAMVAAHTRRVVYVSCDPATLARDARVLAQAGYRVEAAETLELFPQTSHVETVVVFVRGRAPVGRVPSTS